MGDDQRIANLTSPIINPCSPLTSVGGSNQGRIMKLTAEISMYPFNENYLDPIKWFIGRVDSYANIERVTNAMATQVCGEYIDVMTMLATEMQAAHQKWGKAVFVCKFIGGELNLAHSE